MSAEDARWKAPVCSRCSWVPVTVNRPRDGVRVISGRGADPDGKVEMMGNGWVSYYSVQMQARKQKALVHAIAAWLLALAAGPAFADEPAAVPEGSSTTYLHEGFPAFSVGLPAGTRERALEAPAEVFGGSTPDGVDIHVSITDFPFAGILMPIEKAAEYFVGLTEASRTGSDFEVTRNEPITLGDGSSAYRSEVRWRIFERDAMVVTQLVSAYRGGRLVMVAAHSASASEDAARIVESLRFE